jgi:AcrR family transcriptional regulator
MSLNRYSQPARRRRGPALEQALLDAAWEELVDKGYDGLTFEAVADRAQTSRAVIYRRWPSKPELARAALKHGFAKERVAIPDTGNVRDDLVELMRRANASRARIGIMVAMRLGGFFAETGSSISDLRRSVLAPGATAVETILDRAVQRGEIDPARLTPRVVSLPFDLYRNELLMTFRPLPDEVITAIIDEVFMPLVTRP